MGCRKGLHFNYPLTIKPLMMFDKTNHLHHLLLQSITFFCVKVFDFIELHISLKYFLSSEDKNQSIYKDVISQIKVIGPFPWKYYLRSKYSWQMIKCCHAPKSSFFHQIFQGYLQ